MSSSQSRMLNLILEFHFGSCNGKTIKVIRLFFPFSPDIFTWRAVNKIGERELINKHDCLLQLTFNPMGGKP